MGAAPAWGCVVSAREGGSAPAWPPASCALALSTILVEPGCQAEVTETGDIRISVGAEAPSTVGAQLDPIQLSIFSHRFMSIAGQWLPPSVGGRVRGRGVQAVWSSGVCGERWSVTQGKVAVWPKRWDSQPPGTGRPWAL